MKKKNHEDIEIIIKNNTSLILKYCLIKLNNDYHVASDVTQEVMITLFKKWQSLKKDNITAWLYRTADNHIKRYYTKLKKDKQYVIFDCEQQSVQQFENEKMKLETGIYKYIHKIYKSLDDDEKILFTYRYQQDLTLREISKIMNIPYSTLYDKLRKLKGKIETIIKNVLEETGLY